MEFHEETYRAFQEGGEQPAPGETPRAIQELERRNEFNEARAAATDRDVLEQERYGREFSESLLSSVRSGLKAAALRSNPRAIPNSRALTQRIGAIPEGGTLADALPNLSRYLGG